MIDTKMFLHNIIFFIIQGYFEKPLKTRKMHEQSYKKIRKVIKKQYFFGFVKKNSFFNAKGLNFFFFYQIELANIQIIKDALLKQMYMQNSQKHTIIQLLCLHQLSLCYIFDIFWAQTPHKYRVSFKDCGFSIFDKISSEYCWNSLEEDVRNWNYIHILRDRRILTFCQMMAGLAPKIVLKQILDLINQISQLHQSLSEQNILSKFSKYSSEYLDNRFKYLRMNPECLLGMNFASNTSFLLKERMSKVWKPFLTIFVHTIVQFLRNKNENYFQKLLLLENDYPQDPSTLELIIEDMKKTAMIDQNKMLVQEESSEENEQTIKESDSYFEEIENHQKAYSECLFPTVLTIEEDQNKEQEYKNNQFRGNLTFCKTS